MYDFRNNTIKNNDKIFLIIKQIRKNEFQDLKEVQDYKDFIHADDVKQTNEFYIFVNTIDDVEIEEEISIIEEEISIIEEEVK